MIWPDFWKAFSGHKATRRTVRQPGRTKERTFSPVLVRWDSVPLGLSSKSSRSKRRLIARRWTDSLDPLQSLGQEKGSLCLGVDTKETSNGIWREVTSVSGSGDALFEVYDRLDADQRAEIPLKRIWTVALSELIR